MKKIFFFVITTIIFLPTVTFAQQYLVNLPISTQGNFDEYINLLYKMSISIAALLAVVKIIIAGAKYMLSDVVTNKSDAKKDIKGALLGLLLIIGAVIILNTINPALTDGGLNIRKIVVPQLDITAPVKVSVDASGNVTVSGAATNASGQLLKPVIISNSLTCYGNWCPARKYVQWNGQVFSYNLKSHCDDFVKTNTSFDFATCIKGINSALTIQTGPEPDYYGFCKQNGAKDIAITGDVLSCTLPVQVKDTAYYEKRYKEKQASATTQQMAQGSVPYDEEVHFKEGCLEESGKFVMISDDLFDFEGEYYRCVWYQ